MIGTGSIPLLDIDLGAGERISSGNDSNVYRIGERVAKEYHSLGFEAVARYVALQNAAVEAVRRLGYEASFPIRKVPHRVRAREAIPVDEVGLSATGRPLTTSRFIGGPNLEKIMYRPAAFVEWAAVHIPDGRTRDLAAELNDVFWTDYPTRVQDEFQYHVDMLSRRLDRELGVSGLYISRYNVKLDFASDERCIDLIVTDLALYVDRVSYAG